VKEAVSPIIDEIREKQEFDGLNPEGLMSDRTKAIQQGCVESPVSGQRKRKEQRREDQIGEDAGQYRTEKVPCHVNEQLVTKHERLAMRGEELLERCKNESSYSHDDAKVPQPGHLERSSNERQRIMRHNPV
jgi:hypothetical protein